MVGDAQGKWECGHVKWCGQRYGMVESLEGFKILDELFEDELAVFRDVLRHL